jgi:hypothetical protein
MRFLTVSVFVFSCQGSERYCLLIALIVRRSGEIICKGLAPSTGSGQAVQADGASRMGFVVSHPSQSTRRMGHLASFQKE